MKFTEYENKAATAASRQVLASKFFNGFGSALTLAQVSSHDKAGGVMIVGNGKFATSSRPLGATTKS